MTEGNSPKSDLYFRPYVRIDGIPTMKDSEVEEIYHRCFDEGFGDTLFHDGTIKNVEEFRNAVTHPTVMFWIVYNKEEKDEVGFFWLNRIEQTHAYCHFAGFVKYWGKPILTQAGVEAMTLLLKPRGEAKPLFDTIMGMIPSSNTFGIEYLRRVGLKDYGEIPNLLWSLKEQQPVNGYLMYITEKELDE